MTREAYDIAIIGAGSGGLTVARGARDAGLSVVIFEERRAGGTCVNRGCVPKKLLVHASRVGGHLRESAAHGWTTGTVSFDWPRLRDAVATYVGDLADEQRESLVDRGVTFVDERAQLVAPGGVRTEGGDSYSAARIVIATGSRPLVPDIPGAEHALVSDDLFALESLPGHLAIVGGGYIGVEFACMLRRFGVEVTILEKAPRILEGFDPVCVDALRARMEVDGIEVVTGRDVEAVSRDGEAVVLGLDDGSDRDGFDEVALVLGRAANVEDIGLDEIGVERDDNGQIVADDHGRTSVDGVYAIGDVARQPQLTPVANADARNLIDGITGTAFHPIEPDRIPTAVFSTPELGTVGLTGEQAAERGISVECHQKEFSPLSFALSDTDETALVRLVVEAGSGAVLGFHALGSGAADSAQLVAGFLAGGIGMGDLERTMQLHPVAAEELFALAREASA